MAVRNSYRKLSFITDIRGIKNAVGEMKGKGHPRQPKFNAEYVPAPGAPVLDEKWFRETIEQKVENHPMNAMEYPFAGEKIFDQPLVSFVRGDDPIFLEYKKIIGPHHLTPGEWMAWQAVNNGVPAPRAADLSVVSFIMPITERTRQENAAMTEWPSERWAHTRLLGEIFSQAMVREIVSYLMDRGVLAVAPDVTPLMRKQRYPVVGWASPWSHRHIAYAAGLGTFGMHDFLITEKGAAHRCGSFIVNLRLQPDRVRPENIHDNCLHHNGVKCLNCAAKCPVQAIDENGHNKETCYQRVSKSLAYCNKHYHIFIYGCGLCSVGVPCSTGIPVKKKA
ncbi:MAG: epoxyqueuosine reductase [Chloroflexi bacterium]|nr:epoxyqueuosine reductase [Chloroflexota bacterium]